MSEVNQRILVIAIISTTIIVGNIFVLSWLWPNAPIWVSSIATLVALCSMFAWAVAIALICEDS